MKMKIHVALALAVVACFQLAAADSLFDDVEPMQPRLPFDPWWAEGPLREVYDAVDSALPNPHIVGGKESVPHSHPHQVALKVLINQKTAFCGGSLISDQWVVTAGHCASGVQGINVTVGAHNIKQQESTAKTIKAVKIIVHPGYSSINIRNDIALLQLESRVALDKNVNIIRLPKVSQKSESFYKKSVTMSGWGKDSDSASGVSPVLREVDSEVVSNLYCSFRYFFSVVQDSMICASGWNNWKTRGTCNGDSGGPMVVKEDDGERTLIGVTSFGIALGCQWSWPPVFTRVTSYLDWIQSTTGIAPRP